MPEARSVYLYAVGDADLADDSELRRLIGVDDAPVRAVTEGQLAAVVASVDREPEVAVASRQYPPQDPKLTGIRDEMVLNAAYLTDEAGADELRRRVDGRAGGPLRLELTGPWAPYSFIVLGERT